MPRITLLGSAATLADGEHDSIYLLIQTAEDAYLVDCAGSPPHKLARAGADLGRVRGVLLTHDHTDHLYGLPLLIQALMLGERAGQCSGELAIWGLPETLETTRALIDVLRLTEAVALDWRPLAPRS